MKSVKIHSEKKFAKTILSKICRVFFSHTFRSNEDSGQTIYRKNLKGYQCLYVYIYRQIYLSLYIYLYTYIERDKIKFCVCHNFLYVWKCWNSGWCQAASKVLKLIASDRLTYRVVYRAAFCCLKYHKSPTGTFSDEIICGKPESVVQQKLLTISFQCSYFKLKMGL